MFRPALPSRYAMTPVTAIPAKRTAIDQQIADLKGDLTASRICQVSTASPKNIGDARRPIKTAPASASAPYVATYVAGAKASRPN
jgi:hypothetical protein